jgi:predicted NAD/FAD-binding protein
VLAVTVVEAITLQGAVRAAAQAARHLGSWHSSGLRGDGVLAGAAAHSDAEAAALQRQVFGKDPAAGNPWGA